MKKRTLKIALVLSPITVVYCFSGLQGLKVFSLVVAGILAPVLIISAIYAVTNAGKGPADQDTTKDCFSSPRYFWHALNVFRRR